MYDIIFSDYDGTLYGKTREISPKTRKSIEKYVANGGKFVISTGRIYSSIKPIAVSLGLNGDIITSQGSQIYNIDADIPIHTDFINKQKTVEILEIAKREGYLAQCYANNTIYADKSKDFNDFFADFFSVNISTTETLIEDIFTEKIVPNKFELLVDKDKIDGFIKDISKSYPEFLFSKSAPVMIEVVDKLATKGRACRYLLDKYNIKPENALAIGDGNNDIDMLEAVGGKVAVNNAAKRLLKTADYITKDTNGDGVSEIIELILSGKF